MALLSERRQDSIIRFEGMAATADSPSAIEAFLSMAQRMPQHVAIREFIIYHKVGILELADRQARKYKTYESLNSHFPVLRLAKSSGAGKRYSGVIAIFPGSQRNLSRVVTVSLSGFWQAIVRPLVRKQFYPYALPVYFRQQEIGDALAVLEAALPHDQTIHLSDVTSKEERLATKDRSLKDYDTHRVWTDSPWRDVFASATERGYWFTGLKFLIEQQRRSRPAIPVAAGRIYKHGEIHFDFHYAPISASVVKTLESRASARLDLFHDRGIRERNYKPGEPIQVSFEEDVFDTASEIRDFARIMSSYPQSSKAVYHANPYYHASIADFIDGSSFELWVLSQNRILIIPQAKSSAQAFERLIAYVFSEFSEGRVDVYAGAGDSD